MNKGDMVEIVDIDKKDKWLVRNKKNLNQVCFIQKKENELLSLILRIDISFFDRVLIIEYLIFLDLLCTS